MYETAIILFVVLMLGGIYEIYWEHQKRKKDEEEKERLKQRIEKLEKEN